MIDYTLTVPHELGNNLDFREWVSKKGYESRGSAAALRGLCKRNIFFFINSFCWTVNPMWHPDCPEQPFILHPFQESAIRDMQASIGKYDLAIVKSRETGASWLVLLVILHRWLFFRSQSFLLVSRKESLVDNPKDLDALMPKLDFVLERFPRWLRPRLEKNDRVELKLYNPMTGSIISGTSTTGEIGRGGRRTVIIPDEFAFFEARDSYRALRAITGATRSAWFVSTPNGVGNAFHDLIESEETKKLVFRWEEMPHKRHGLYRSDDDRLEVLDSGYEFPEGYRFVLDGKLRSVWYDAEERRTPVKSLMAQEHDRSFIGSGSPFFDPTDLESLKCHVRTPSSTKKYYAKNGTKGVLRLWLPDRASKSPPLDRKYVLGVDVSAGTGASNSCISVFDARLKEKVAELAEPKCDPTELAEIAAEIGDWFQDWIGEPALIIWENNGSVGRIFGKRLLELEYANLYYPHSGSGSDEVARGFPGFSTTAGSKQLLLRDYAVALCRGGFIEHSAEGLKECQQFFYGQSGKIEHRKASGGEDASGARENHGDRVIGNALSLHGAAGVSDPVPTMDNAVEPNYPCLYNDLREERLMRRNTNRLVEGWLEG